MNETLKIIVCIKQVPDTTEVRIDPKTGTLVREGVPSIMNPDDKAGVEAALQIKDSCNAEVTVLTMGPPQAEVVLREAMAMGADRGILVTDRAFGGSDTIATSTVLAAAIRTQPFDLVITGRQAIDGDTAQVGPQIAEFLKIPSVAYVESIRREGEDLLVRRRFENFSHLIRVKMPCLITVLSDLNFPRYMTPGGIFDAWRHKKIQVFAHKDLPELKDGEIGLRGSPTRVAKSFPKAVKSAGVVKANLRADEAADVIATFLQSHFVI